MKIKRQKRELALALLEQDLRVGKKRQDGKYGEEPLTEGNKKRITKEIELLKSKINKS